MPPKKAKEEVKATEKVEKAAAPSKAPESDSNLMAAIAEFFSLTVLVPILLYLVKKEDKFVKFHALQATVLGVVTWVLAMVFAVGFGAAAFVLPPLGLASLCCYPIYGIGGLAALYLAYVAYQGQKYKLPAIGNFVEKYV